MGVHPLADAPPRDLTGKRILDFGCGVGRILLPAARSAPETEFWGCDTHPDSIEWLSRQAPASVRVFRTNEMPPMDAPTASFDMAYAFSVFTHLVDSWSAWLAELHRVLEPGGILIATIFGPGHHDFAGEPISEEIIGMNVLNPSASWDIGGPLVAHSRWWIEAHWGRAFEILEIRPGVPAGPPPLFGQGVVVMRRRDVEVTAAELERPAESEPRELLAAQQNNASLRRELERHAVYVTSRSWRLTAPLRAAARQARRLTGRPS